MHIAPATMVEYRRVPLSAGGIIMIVQKQKYLTEAEVSNLTGFALSTLRNWRFERRGIPYLRIGKRSIRYRYDDVVAFMETNHITLEV